PGGSSSSPAPSTTPTTICCAKPTATRRTTDDRVPSASRERRAENSRRWQARMRVDASTEAECTRLYEGRGPDGLGHSGFGAYGLGASDQRQHHAGQAGPTAGCGRRAGSLEDVRRRGFVARGRLSRDRPGGQRYLRGRGLAPGQVVVFGREGRDAEHRRGA